MKKMFKSSTNRQIMGVCGGLGEYLNIDPTFVRIVFAIAFFVFGIGFLPYILLGIILPYDYQVNGGRFDDRRTVNDSYVYRNQRQSQSDIFSSLNQRRGQQPKDVTPQDEDEWSDF